VHLQTYTTALATEIDALREASLEMLKDSKGTPGEAQVRGEKKNSSLCAAKNFLLSLVLELILFHRKNANEEGAIECPQCNWRKMAGTLLKHKRQGQDRTGHC